MHLGSNPPADGNGITTAFVGKTISGNLISGVGTAVTLGDDTGGDRVQGNLIGTDATGTLPIPNGQGVVVFGSNNDLIGGTTPGARNIIAFNDGPGIAAGGTGNQIEGNSIYSNTGPGVWVESDPFGSADPHGPFNDGLATGISIERNSIYGNGGLGIALGNTAVDANRKPLTLAQFQANPSSWVNDIPNGVVLNDSLSHVGANNFQDFPVLTSAAVSGSNVTVSGTLPTNSGTAPFTVDVYASPTADPSYYGLYGPETWVTGVRRHG